MSALIAALVLGQVQSPPIAPSAWHFEGSEGTWVRIESIRMWSGGRWLRRIDSPGAKATKEEIDHMWQKLPEPKMDKGANVVEMIVAGYIWPANRQFDEKGNGKIVILWDGEPPPATKRRLGLDGSSRGAGIHVFKETLFKDSDGHPYWHFGEWFSKAGAKYIPNQIRIAVLNQIVGRAPVHQELFDPPRHLSGKALGEGILYPTSKFGPFLSWNESVRKYAHDSKGRDWNYFPAEYVSETNPGSPQALISYGLRRNHKPIRELFTERVRYRPVASPPIPFQ